MAGNNRKDDALELLSRTERELVSGVLRHGDPRARPGRGPVNGFDDTAFMRLAQLRLRNIVEKHSEALKRARRATGSGGIGDDVATLELQLWICSEALEVCRRRLQSTGERD